MASEFRALRASVIRLWTRDMKTASRETLYEMTRFNEAIDEAWADSVRRYHERLDRSREIFLAVLGHDLRSPLGAVLNSAHFLLYQEELSGFQAKAASTVLRAGKRIERMVSDLLEVARTRLGQSLPVAPAEVDLREICEKVVEEARAYHPERIIGFTASGDCRGTWDEARLQQMLGNLVQNAMQHGRAAAPVTVLARGVDDEVSVSVHNQGEAIPESVRARIFEPMVRDEGPAGPQVRAGLGLGLYIARTIAEAHGGTIACNSSAADGTTFRVRLPRRGPNQGAAAA